MVGYRNIRLGSVHMEEGKHGVRTIGKHIPQWSLGRVLGYC